MGAVLKFTHQLEAICCCNCGVQFGIPESLLEQRRGDKKSFFCPNGHSQSYTESEADKLRKRLEWKQKELERAQARATTLERSRNSYKGKVTTLRNRVGHGVCPCCNRTFQQLARHMKCKHPNYATESEA